MKKIKLFVFIIGCFLFPKAIPAQIRIEKQLFVEIKDTVEVAYRHYYSGEWSMKGSRVYPTVKKDFVGLDSIRITRLYYFDNDYYTLTGTYLGKKIYIDLILKKEYLSKRKGNDRAENNYN